MGENCRSDMLSDGSWPWGISMSLLVSPVVELLDAAGAEPKSAIVVVAVEFEVVGCSGGALRERVVVPR